MIDFEPFFIVETENYKSRHDTYDKAFEQAKTMSELTNKPSFIFELVNVVTVKKQ